MPNEIQIECYFKSSDLAALCKSGKDIIVRFKASFPPDSKPAFVISADNFTKGAKTKKPTKNLILADPGGSGGGTGGCPKPC